MTADDAPRVGDQVRLTIPWIDVWTPDLVILRHGWGLR